jgi:hypothetical protein
MLILRRVRRFRRTNFYRSWNMCIIRVIYYFFIVKVIFDAFNEALDSFRLFGLRGKPFPWVFF